MRVILLGCALGACGVVKDTPDAGVPIDAAIDAAIDAPASLVSITPANPKTNDDLLATVNGATGFTLQWSKNGVVRSDIAGPIVDHLLTTRGELWRVDVLSGTTVLGSAETTILNSAPPPPVVHVTPNVPGPGFPIKCAMDMPSPDADGDAVSFTITWMKNGIPYTGATTTTTAGDTVPAADVAVTDAFVCTIMASDGTDMTAGTSAVATAQCATGGSMTFAANGTFETGTIQMFTAPTNICAARIDAAGGKGGVGGAAGSSNTNGAEMIGTFPLLAGTQLKILVGQAAQLGTQTAEILAGGGGTFVVDMNNNPLVIAGGGGSNFSATIPDAELEGRIVTSGGIGGTATRADNGQGGTSLNSTSGAGGGLLGDGASGGLAFVHGGNGNPGDGESHAGYGGGGSRTAGTASGSFGEGGGGGYSGGSCGNTTAWAGCGGGGSINLGTNQVNTAGANNGNGFVKITW